MVLSLSKNVIGDSYACLLLLLKKLGVNSDVTQRKHLSTDMKDIEGFQINVLWFIRPKLSNINWNLFGSIWVYWFYRAQFPFWCDLTFPKFVNLDIFRLVQAVIVWSFLVSFFRKVLAWLECSGYHILAAYGTQWVSSIKDLLFSAHLIQGSIDF